MLLLASFSTAVRPYSASKFSQFSNSQLSFGLFFTAPWCESCKDAEDQVELVAQQAYEAFTILRVDCSNPKQKEVCIEYKAKQLPAFIILNNLPSKIPQHYSGQYQAKKISKFVREYINSPLFRSPHPLGLLEAFKNPPQDKTRPFVIFFTQSENPPYLLIRLAYKFFNKATFMHQIGFNDNFREELKNTEMYEKLRANEFNCVVRRGSLYFYYKGELEFKQLRAFLNEHLQQQDGEL